jgi:two-component system NtrC family sensor kinase
MKCLLVFLLAAGLVYSTPTVAQTRAVDSLQALLKAATRPDTVRIRRLRMLAKETLASDLPQSIRLLNEALALSQSIPDPKQEGSILISLATAARRQTNYALARDYTQQAKAVFTRSNDWAGLGKTYLQLSVIDMVQGNSGSAMRAALQGLPYAERAGDRVIQTQLQATLGSIYVQLGNYTDALPVLRAALKNGRAVHNDPVVAASLNLLGNTHRMLRNWPQALSYFQQSVSLNQKTGDTKSATIDEINISELYTQQGNHEQALKYGLEARALARANKDTYNLPGAELALARIFLATQRLDSAIALAQHGFDLSQPTNSNENLRNASDILAQAYAQRGIFDKAYQYQRMWVAYQDSLAGAETQRKTSAMRYGYELDKKQSQIALLSKEKQLQRQQLTGLLAGLLTIVLVAGLLIRNIYLKQRTNRALNEKNDHIAQQRDDLNHTLVELKATQGQLVQSEKMVALAALTAGVAHEIQNPLNFVNNFSEVSLELISELEEEAQKPARDPALEAELLRDLKQNLRKIHQHGARAGDIVKGMLEHARADAGQRQPIDLNVAAEDYLRLAYHALEAKHRGCAVQRILAPDPKLDPLQLVPQEIGRVLLNLFTNALYAVHQKSLVAGPAYTPEVRVSTRQLPDAVELRIRDNGTGIPAAALGKIFEPFFTTKPPGEGTGLGLWFSYDIITKGYGGTLTVQTQEGAYTEFVLTLPRATTPLTQPEPLVLAKDLEASGSWF